MHLQIVEVSTRLSGRYVASAPHSWTMRVGQQKPAVRAGTDQAAGLLSGQLFGPGGNTTLEYWIDGRRIRAAWKAPSRKRPCRSRPLPVDPSFFVSRRLHGIGSRIKRFLHRLVRHHHGSMTTSRGQNEHRSRQLGSRLCGRSARASAPMCDWPRSSVIFERFLPWSRVACAVAH
jgi:hypothetical protein